jgi:thioesterase domain-containing protein
LGGDSLATLELLLSIEESLGTVIDTAAFLERPTVEGLAAVINENREFRPVSALVAVKTEGSLPPLFIIHGAGGLAFTVFELSQTLNCDRPIIVVQDPACDPNREPARRIEHMATALIREITPIQSNGPFYLCGHSFGGLLAYEMARQLSARGETVAFLGMIDTPTPPRSLKHWGLRARFQLIRRELHLFWQILTQAGPMAADGAYVLFAAESRYHDRREVDGDKTLRQSIKRFWSNGLYRYFHRRAGLASAVERDSRLLLLRQPSIRRSMHLTGIHDTARRHYLPDRYNGPITLFRAEQPSAETQGFPGKALGWDRLATDITTYHSPGSHFTMTRG